MQNDKITLNDLTVFGPDGEDVFALIDRTTTQAGKEVLKRHIYNPPATLEKLNETQEVIRFWANNPDLWSKRILNGTLVMLDKYFESADNISAPPSGLALMIDSIFQKLINKRDHSIVKFAISHLSDFLIGCSQLAEIADKANVPKLLKQELDAIKSDLSHRLVEPITNITNTTTYSELAQLNYKARREMKQVFHRLISRYTVLDAWHSMAIATLEHNWVFPEISPSSPVIFEAVSLEHPLLRNPVPYSISFTNNCNFLILTGANMAGKTTFLRSLGISALLTHLGMGVPAKSLKISFLQGVITNMHVEDNILKGESYFYAEVLRMKQTAKKLQQPGLNLLLMDELFKGTNVHDAFECTKAVIEGLLYRPNQLIILSTHLCEVARQFEQKEEIQFAYFVTNTGRDGNYNFTYELKKGISNDRIGFRILQKEGVIDILKSQQSI